MDVGTIVTSGIRQTRGPGESLEVRLAPMRIDARNVLVFALGLGVLLALNALGDWLVRVSGATVPGSVVGMLLLAVLIETRILPLAAVRGELLAIAAAGVASLVAVLVVVGLVVQRLERAE